MDTLKEIEEIKLEECPFRKWCPHRTGGCVALPDDGCPVYRYFKQLILNETMTK